jgi:RecA-family ATPase
MTDPLKPDRDQLEKFLDALLRYRGEDGYLSMRAFLHDNKPLNSNIWTVRLGAHTGSRHALDVAFDMANRAANHPQPAVFCPPIAVFNNADGFKAGEADLYRGLAISVECDEHPLEAQAKLQDILGQATAVVRSGGQWINGDGVPEDKVHLHWRLSSPATGEALKKLKRTRALATAIVGGDPSNVPAVHCLRWPGSWHRKAIPRLCEFIHCTPEREIDLDEALKLLEAEAPPFRGGGGGGCGSDYTGEFVDLQELVRRIISGENLHLSVGRIAGKFAREGAPLSAAEAFIEAAFTAASAPRYDGRLQECLDYVRWVYAKEEQKRKPETPAILINPTKWQDQPVSALQWIVPDWIPQGRVFGMYGSGGEGKTTLMQQLLTSCAIDHGWLGLKVTPMRALGVFCEDDTDDLHRRQACINASYDCQFSDLENMALLPRLGHDNMLMRFDKGVPRLTPFWDEIKQAALNFGAQLVVIDTIADTFGGSEIDRAQVRQYVQMALGGLARAIPGGTVVATAHPSLAGISSGTGSSGSTAWDATFRSRAYLRRPETEKGEAEPDPCRRELERVKSNYARRNETLRLLWKDGVFINVATASYIPDPPPCVDVFLDLLSRILSEGRHVSHNSRSGNYAPKVFSRRPDRFAYRKSQFERAMEELFVAGRIKVARYRGADRKEYEHVIPVA